VGTDTADLFEAGILEGQAGPAEVRLSGAPSPKLPEQIPVHVPIVNGEVYHFADAQWSGNGVISSIALGNYFGLKQGAVADGMEIEAALDRVREEYGRGVTWMRRCSRRFHSTKRRARCRIKSRLLRACSITWVDG